MIVGWRSECVFDGVEIGSTDMDEMWRLSVERRYQFKQTKRKRQFCTCF